MQIWFWIISLVVGQHTTPSLQLKFLLQNLIASKLLFHVVIFLVHFFLHYSHFHLFFAPCITSLRFLLLSFRHAWPTRRVWEWVRKKLFILSCWFSRLLWMSYCGCVWANLSNVIRRFVRAHIANTHIPCQTNRKLHIKWQLFFFFSLFISLRLHYYKLVNGVERSFHHCKKHYVSGIKLDTVCACSRARRQWVKFSLCSPKMWRGKVKKHSHWAEQRVKSILCR